MTTILGQPVEDVAPPRDSSDDLQLYSVTTIIGVLHKQALLYWSAEQAAEAALDYEELWKAMLTTQGRAETVTWLRDAFNRLPKTRLSAANLGTATHKVCQQYGMSGVKPDQEFIAGMVRRYALKRDGTTTVDIPAEAEVVTQMLDQFDRWAQRFQPVYQAVEMTVFNPRMGMPDNSTPWRASRGRAG